MNTMKLDEQNFGYLFNCLDRTSFKIQDSALTLSKPPFLLFGWRPAALSSGRPLRDYNFKLPDKGGGRERERDHKKSFCPSFVIAKREEPLLAAAAEGGGEIPPSPPLRSGCLLSIKILPALKFPPGRIKGGSQAHCANCYYH